MKKLVWIPFFLTLVIAEDNSLFFSEYAEGSSYNKYLEIYNGTGASVTLTNYQIAQSVDGGGWQYYHIFPSGPSIADGDVWVITTDQADASLQAVADEVLSYPSVVHHNGDDARGLISISGTDTTWIDIIGDPNNDPGSGWDVAGVTNGTQNHTLVRKSTVTSGNTDWSASAGTTTDNSEWIVYDQNYFGNLGFHLSPYSAEHIVITNDTLVVLEDSSSTIDLLDNDLILNITSFTLAIVDSADNGTIALVGHTALSYSPNANFFGHDTVTYRMFGSEAADTGLVLITVTAVDDIPIASNDTVTVSEDTDYSGTLMASDGDGDALTFSIIDSTVNGTVTLSDPTTGTFTYSPLANFNGSDSLLFSASDGILLDTGSVTIVVTTIDDLPVVANPLPDITVNEDASDTTLGDLKNVFLDVDEELIYSHVVNDSGLVFVSVANDTVTLQFLADANGSTDIVFTAVNPTSRASVSDTILVTVLAVNDAPDATPIVEACVNAGAYVVTQWNKPNELHPWDHNPNYVSHISFSGVPYGEKTAQALIDAIGGSGGIVALGGIPSNIPAIERKKGLDNVLKRNPSVELLDHQVANWSETEAFNIVSAWLTRFGDKIKGIWAANDGMGVGALEALRAENLAGKVPITGIDGVRVAVEAVLAGEFAATVAWDPFWQGGMGLSIGYQAKIGKFNPSNEPNIHREFYGKGMVVTKNNAQSYYNSDVLDIPKIDWNDIWGRVTGQIKY